MSREVGLIPLQKCSQCILLLQLTGLFTFDVIKLYPILIGDHSYVVKLLACRNV